MMTLAARPALLGRDIARIRKTNQTPPKVSVIDVVQTITGKDAKHAAEEVRGLRSTPKWTWFSSTTAILAEGRGIQRLPM